MSISCLRFPKFIKKATAVILAYVFLLGMLPIGAMAAYDASKVTDTGNGVYVTEDLLAVTASSDSAQTAVSGTVSLDVGTTPTTVDGGISCGGCLGAFSAPGSQCGTACYNDLGYCNCGGSKSVTPYVQIAGTYDTTVASAEIIDGKLNITGLKAGTTQIGIQGVVYVAPTYTTDTTKANYYAYRYTQIKTIDVTVSNATISGPSGLTATVGTGSVVLTWPAVTGATGYNIYESTTSGTYTTALTGVTVSDSGANKTATISGLTNGTPYYFTITSTVSGAESSKSAEVSATPLAAPSASIAVSVSGVQLIATLTWTAVTGATSYKIYTGSSSGSLTATDTTTSQTYTYSLNSGAATYFGVSATNSNGESSQKTLNSVPSTSVSIASYTNTSGAGTATLSWSQISGAVGYKLYKAVSSGNYTNVTPVDVAAPGDTTSKVTTTVAGLTDGNAYSFKVQAVYDSGTPLLGVQSAESTVMTPITGLTINSNLLGSQNSSLPEVTSFKSYSSITTDSSLTHQAFVEITYNKNIALTNGSASLLSELAMSVSGSIYINGSIQKYTTVATVVNGNTLRLSFTGVSALTFGLTYINTLARTGIVNGLSAADGSSASVNFPDLMFYFRSGVQLDPVTQTPGTATTPASVTKTLDLSQRPVMAAVHYLFLSNGVPVGTLNASGYSFDAHYMGNGGSDNTYPDHPELYAPNILSGLASFTNYTAAYDSTTHNITITAKSNTAGEVLDLIVFAYPYDRTQTTNKTALNTAISNAATALTSASNASALTAELARANAIKASSYYLQSDVDAETTALNNAIVSAPSTLTVLSGDKQATLTWSAASNATAYNVYVKTSDASDYTLIGSKITSTSYTATGLTNGTTYYFKVSAVNLTVESPGAALATAKPAAASTSGNTTASTAPVRMDMSVYTGHSGASDGMTDDQYIAVDLTFDQTLTLTSGAINDLLISLNGAASPSGDTSTYNGASAPVTSSLTYNQLTSISANGNVLHLEIHVPFAIYGGLLTITPASGTTFSDITNSKGTPIAGIGTINLYVPNGVKLTTASQTAATSSTAASVTKTVTTTGAIRAMVHMLLMKNGVPVGSLDSYGATFTAHYHAYLTLNATTFASTIASASGIPSGYTITSSGDTVTVTAANSTTGDVLDLLVWAYPRSTASGAGTSALSSAISTAQAVTKSSYSDTAYVTLENALAVAQKVLSGSGYYLQTEIDAVTLTLNSAIAGKTTSAATGGPSTTASGSADITAKAGTSGTAAATVSSDNITEALKNAGATTGKSVALTLNVTVPANSTGLTTTLPKDALTSAISGGATSITISSSICDVTFDGNALSTIKSAATGDISVSITPTDTSKLSGTAKDTIGSRPDYDLSVTSGGTAISSFNGGTATVSIPYTPASGENVQQLVIYYIGSDGALNMVTNCVYDAVTKSVKFSTGHFSTYAVGYKTVSFSDVSGWYQDYVNYLSARGIVSGIGSGLFVPDNTITRAEFVTILAKLAGAKLSDTDSTSFADVGTDDWYASAVQWANDNGIATGYEGTFNPNGQITRQDMAVMLMRFADKFTAYTLNQAGTAVTFIDEASISSYAKDAVLEMQKASIISGYTDGSFSPTGSATRAAAAKMIALMIQGRLK